MCYFTGRANRKFRKQFPWVLLLKVWPKHQYQLGARQIYKTTGPIQDPLSPAFGKIPRFFIAPVKSEEQFSRDRPTRTAVPNLLGTRDQKKIFPWTGGRCGSGSNSSDKEQQTKLLSLTPATLRATHLLLCSPVPNRPWDQHRSSA